MKVFSRDEMARELYEGRPQAEDMRRQRTDDPAAALCLPCEAVRWRLTQLQGCLPNREVVVSGEAEEKGSTMTR
jgi:hypothetical protein